MIYLTQVPKRQIIICYADDYPSHEEVFAEISGQQRFVFAYYFVICPGVAVPICSEYRREKLRAIYDAVFARILSMLWC